jgi:carboxynorspermidine decarboxylase
MNIPIETVPTPCYLVDEAALERNLSILSEVQEKTGCKILLALKGFAMWSLAPIIMRHLRGTTASSLHEARLGFEEFGGEVHVCAPAYVESDFEEILAVSDHIVFNSFSEWARHGPRAMSVLPAGLMRHPDQPRVFGSPVPDL